MKRKIKEIHCENVLYTITDSNFGEYFIFDFQYQLCNIKQDIHKFLHIVHKQISEK